MLAELGPFVIGTSLLTYIDISTDGAEKTNYRN